VNIAGKVAVVTGAGAGIGEAIARRMAREAAARVAVADIDADRARRVAEEIGGLAVAVDCGKEDEVESLIELVEAELGAIDIFVSNAGIAMAGGVEVATDQWQRIWDVNLMASVFAARRLLPAMVARGTGYLVITASAAGLLTNLGAAPYAVTKHAAVALAEWLAITYGDAGIRVAVICPEFVRTPMLARAAEDLGSDQWFQQTAIEPSEVAEALVAGMAEDRFLILPHPSVGDYFRSKAENYDGWILGMRKLQRRLGLKPPAW
jgi:NAD(P)-dependent dehydrogenase (short-subunit alcohol dehydrogenase family)